MARFEEFQQLWQRQPQRAMPLDDAAELSNAFRRYGRRQDAIYLGKLLVLGCQLVILLSLLRHRPIAAFGGCLADFSAILFLISDWRTQRAIARLNFAAPSVKFLRSAIARLDAQRNRLRTREFYIAMGGFWIGCNVMLADTWHLMTLSQALLAFAIITATPFLAYAQALRIRRKRFEKECRPLIRRLESLLQTMEADPV